MSLQHDILDSMTGLGVGWYFVPIEAGSPTIYNMAIQMADTEPYLGQKCNAFNGGAGLTPEEAKWAAIGEAAERYCSAVLLKEKMVFGTWKELHGQNPLHPNEIALFAPFQKSRLPRALFSENSKLNWVKGTSLLDGRPRLVPACLIYIPYMKIWPGEDIIGPAISTGMACGPDKEWTLFSGLWEYLERDAFAIYWFNQQPAHRILMDEPWIEELMKNRFQRPNLEYHVFLLETDLPFPTVVCFIKDTNFEPAMVAVGGACRMDVRQALEKALVEAVQGWTWARSIRMEHGSAETPTDFQHITEFDKRVELYARSDMSEALSFLLDQDATVNLSDLPTCEMPKDEVKDLLLDSIKKQGGDVVYIDLTTPEILHQNLVVGKVYCTALQQIEGNFNHPLLGGRRWRDVPVKMGWRDTPSGQEDLNPFPHPYP